MEYRRLGRSGLKISKLALGTMNFGNPTDKTESFRIINTALDAGINLAPSPFESGFVSAAHGDEEINTTLNAAEAAFQSIRS